MQFRRPGTSAAFRGSTGSKETSHLSDLLLLLLADRVHVSEHVAFSFFGVVACIPVHAVRLINTGELLPRYTRGLDTSPGRPEQRKSRRDYGLADLLYR